MKNHRLHELLKRCREEANISQEILAAKMFVDQSYISKVENGRGPTPSYDFVKRWGIATSKSELIAIDLAGDEDERYKETTIYRYVIAGIKSSLEYLEISV